MEEKMNLFGKNQSEIGSLDENLVLRTKGKVYIRYGKKYIELLDSQGNLNVKVPKVITKGTPNTSSDGFYLTDETLYACVDGTVIQLSGVEGQFISYIVSLNLTQEQLNITLKNIGLKYNSISEAMSIVKEGIVFVNGDIYYINNGQSSKINQETTPSEISLNAPLKNINETNLNSFPDEDYSCIAFVNGEWTYLKFLTLENTSEITKGLLKEPLYSINSLTSPKLKNLPTVDNSCITRVTKDNKKVWDYVEMTPRVDFNTLAVVGASYDQPTQTIQLKNSNNEIIASIKDGMVDSVNVIVDERKLIVSYNQESGKPKLQVDLKNIFDEYYTKLEINKEVVASASYDSDTHIINFKSKDGSLCAWIDATDFIKDGMVNSVSIDTTKRELIIVFNTDSGKDEITLSLNDIFNPANYYTKTDTDTKFATINSVTTLNNTVNSHINNTTVHLTSDERNTWNTVSSKASQSDLNTLSGTVSGHTGNTTIHVTLADKNNWNNKSTFSGNYNDLSNKPTIPTVNNSTITIKQTGLSDLTFTLNGGNATITLADTTYNFSGTSFTSNNSTGQNANNVTYNSHTYYTSNGPSTTLGASTNDGALFTLAYSTSWVAQIAQDYRNGNLFTRGKNNGTWTNWRKVMYTGDALTKTLVTNALGYTPPTTDTNTWRPLGTGANDACAGNDSRLSNARPASDVYSWAKASTKPTYTASEVGAAAASHTHEYLPLSGGTLSNANNVVLSLKRLASGGPQISFYPNNLTSTYWRFGSNSSHLAVNYCEDSALCWFRSLLLGTYDRGMWLQQVNGYSTGIYIRNSDELEYHSIGLSIGANGTTKGLRNTSGNSQGQWLLWFNGHSDRTANATAFSSLSDERYKDIQGDITLTVEQIAAAPSKLYKWKDSNDTKIYGGSTAQYWEGVTPWAVSEADDIKSLNYPNLALVTSILNAREIINLKQEIFELKAVIAELKENKLN